MRASFIVEGQISTDRCARLRDAVAGAQIDFLVSDAAPQPLDKDIVAPSALAIHADGDLGVEQHAGEVQTGELAP